METEAIKTWLHAIAQLYAWTAYLLEHPETGHAAGECVLEQLDRIETVVRGVCPRSAETIAWHRALIRLSRETAVGPALAVPVATAACGMHHACNQLAERDPPLRLGELLRLLRGVRPDDARDQVAVLLGVENRVVARQRRVISATSYHLAREAYDLFDVGSLHGAMNAILATAQRSFRMAASLLMTVVAEPAESEGGESEPSDADIGEADTQELDAAESDERAA